MHTSAKIAITIFIINKSYASEKNPTPETAICLARANELSACGSVSIKAAVSATGSLLAT